MGNGASIRGRGRGDAARRAEKGKAKEKDRGKEGRRRKKHKSGSSSDDSSDSEEVQVNPSRQRRRRVLFRTQPGQSRQFETLEPLKQFRAYPEETNDPVFERLGSPEVVNEFRRRAEGVRWDEDKGYLGDNALELLELGLQRGSTLWRRLYEVGQVQGGLPRNRLEKLTCYELLALYSIFRGGTDEELLELLFCIFDADGDDRLSAADLATSIQAFMEFQEGEDQEVFNLDVKARQQQAKKMADKALKAHYKPEPSRDVPSDSENEIPSAPPTPPLGRRLSGTSNDGSQAESDLSTKPRFEKDVKAKEDRKPKPKRRGFCKGKVPPDSDDESESRSFKSKSKSKSGRGGWRSSSSRSRSESRSGSATPKKQPAPPPRRPAPPRRALCGGLRRGRPQGPPALSFGQWCKWVRESQFLPETWTAALGTEDIESPRSDAEDTPPIMRAGASRTRTRMLGGGAGGGDPDDKSSDDGSRASSGGYSSRGRRPAVVQRTRSAR